MRLCRYQHNGTVEVALYFDDRVASLNRVADELKIKVPTAGSLNILDYLPPQGRSAKAAVQVEQQYLKLSPADQRRLSRPMKEARLRVPVPEPKKIILLAGNYAAHIVEGGGKAVERQETFPYFFWKPPSTTLTHPGDPIRIPLVSPNHIDWEVELGVVIGRTCRHVTEKEALGYVAGYSVCNDISDRVFRINPQRKPREKDAFFDWLHGKWHDTFLPMGPHSLRGIGPRPAEAAPDAQGQRQDHARRQYRPDDLLRRRPRVDSVDVHDARARRHPLDGHAQRRRPRSPAARLSATQGRCRS